jgi:small subunit ribosomal protein S13
MAKQESNEKHLIRIMGTDINADLSLLYGLAKIKGVNVMFSNAVCAALNLDKGAKISSLSEEDVEKIEEFLSNPEMPGIPEWMKNQRKEYESGKDLHLTSKDIEFNMLQYRRRFAKTKSYKALRHKARLPVRGQRTKSNFRRNKTLAAMKAKRGGR